MSVSIVGEIELLQEHGHIFINWHDIGVYMLISCYIENVFVAIFDETLL